MKKIFYCIISFWILIFESCQRDFTLTTPPPPPVACDNSNLTNYTIQMNFAGTDYSACPLATNGGIQPPMVTAYNYLHQPSYGNPDPSANSSPGNSFLCSIITKNLQPSENPTNACILGVSGSIQSYWSTSSVTQQVQGFFDHGTGVMIDYYDVCVPCFYDGTGANNNVIKALPHFISAATIPKHMDQQGQTLWTAIMFNDTYYLCKNCK